MTVTTHEIKRISLVGVAAGALAVAVVAGAIALFDNWVPVLSLGVLFVFAVLPIAVFWGTPYAVLVAVASMLTFNFFFLPPVYTFNLADGRNWFALAVYLTTAIVVGALASRARRQTAEAASASESRLLLADVASELLRGTALAQELDRVEKRAAEVLGVSSVRIALGESDAHGESPYPLPVDGGELGTLYTPEREEPALSVRRRVLPALASLLAVANERERLARDALEAEALRRSDAIKTAIIQAVSHDLRTPLATIETALDGLESNLLVLSDVRSGGAAGDHSRRARPAQAVRREPPRPLADPGGSCASDARVLDGRRADLTGAGGPAGRGARARRRPSTYRPSGSTRRRFSVSSSNLIENSLKFSPADEPVTST